MHLVHDAISRDTEQCVTQIMEATKAGQVLGIAFILVLKRKRYMVNTAGAAAENPTDTRGMLCALDDELQRMVQGRATTNPTL